MAPLTSPPTSTVAPSDLSVWRALLREQVRVTRALQAALLAAHDLALPAFDVLSRLAEAPEGRLRMNDLAERVLLSRSGLTRLVDRLEREGTVHRESCASDARGLYAVLTATGRDLLAEAAPTYERVVAETVLGRLDETDVRTLGAILDRISRDARPERPTP